jgi:hypothetical protein
VPFKTFSQKSSTLSSDFFGGIAFGINVFLRCHTDADFTMNIKQVFLKGHPEYQLNDQIIAYFCFLTLGVAVPLRPGDYFMFNALIPHCISSRCNMEDEIMCTSVVKMIGVKARAPCKSVCDLSPKIINAMGMSL